MTGFWKALGAELMKSPGQRSPAASAAKTTAAALHCPHCDTSGQVKRRKVKVKQGVSGGKATGAVLTGGLSLVATGLSRKNEVTEMTCGNCGTVWHVA